MRKQLSPVLLSVVLLAACSDTTSPAGQVEDVGSLPTASAGASTEKGTSIYVVNDLGFMDCVGEDVKFDAEIPFKYHIVSTPSGVTAHNDGFIPNSAVGTAVGQTSGTVWTLDHVISPGMGVSTGSTSVAHFTATQFWVSQTGPTMHLTSVFHILENGQGGVVVEKFSFTCRLQ